MEKNITHSDKTDREKNSKRRLYALIIFGASVFLILLLLRLFVLDLHNMVAGSMNPSLEKEDNILAIRVGWYFGLPARNSIVTYRPPHNPKAIWAKRLIGLPNETVEIIGGKVTIDGKPIEKPYEKIDSLDSTTLVTLGPDEVYILGDNRANSVDSRSYGPVKTKDIVGCVVFRYWPLSRFGRAR